MKLLQKIALTTLMLGFMGSTVFAEVAVIVNKSNNATISTDDIERIFLGKDKSFSDGSSAIPVNLNTSAAVRESFDDKALGKSTNQTKAYWSKLVFSGKGNPPKEVDSEAEMIELVSKNPSVIGYVDASNVTDAVRVVTKL